MRTECAPGAQRGSHAASLNGSILRTAEQLIAGGFSPGTLPDVLPRVLRRLDGAWGEAVLAGDEPPDLARLAALVAADGVDWVDAYDLLGRDAEAAIFEAEHRLRHPDPGDNPAEIRREIARLNVVQRRRQQTWDDAVLAADYELDATVSYASAAPDVPLIRPSVTMETAAAGVRASLLDAIHGNGPRHVLIDAGMGTRKTHTAVTLVATVARQRRIGRQRWIAEYRRENPAVSYSDAARAADDAGIRLFRVLYLAETHLQARGTVQLGRQLGMHVEHHGGYDRGIDPADPTLPPVCSQPERLKHTQLAGESMPEKGCGRTPGAVPCPDLGGCRRWSRLFDCGMAELICATTDVGFDLFMPKELTGFDLVIIDESPDRAGYGETVVAFDSLSDRHFDAHPVRDAAGEPDLVANALARAEFKRLRDTLDTAPNGYAPMEALRAAGFDADRWLQLIDWTNARDKPSGITSATPDDERGELARASFRRQVRGLCALFRKLAEPGDGWVRLDGADRRIAIVRGVRGLHPSILDGRVIALDGSADLASWRRFLPDLEVVTTPRPRAPHEMAVQIVRPNGKHAMRKASRKGYNKALHALYAHGPTGVLTHLEHVDAFTTPGTVVGNFMGLAGRNDWAECSTILSYGLPFLSPEAAAFEAAGRTGEAVVPAMPTRTLRPVMMKNGGVTLVPSMEYEHPGAREAQAAVRDRQAMQGFGGRPRGANRTADNPVLSIYVGTTPIPGMEFDHVITGPEQFAPDRFVRMVAEDLVVASGPDRHRLHPEIYAKIHTAEYDMPRETGGMIETLRRVLYPAWWQDRPRRTWLELRYWVTGRGNRVPGRLAACPVGQVAMASERLRAACGAVRIEVVGEVPRPPLEVPRIRVNKDITWILGTSPKRRAGPLFPSAVDMEELDRLADDAPNGG